MATNPNSAESLMLYGEKDEVTEVIGNITGTSGSYTKAKIEGSNSFYVVYRHKKWDSTYKTLDVHGASKVVAKAGSTSMVIVDGNAVVDLGFRAQSAQGFPKNGITFFKHDWFCGHSRHCTDSIASGTEFLGKGPSSMIITKGWWTFYKEPDFKGEMLTLNGQTKFGPGIRMGLPPDFCDNVKSIKYSDTVI